MSWLGSSLSDMESIPLNSAASSSVLDTIATQKERMQLFDLDTVRSSDTDSSSLFALSPVRKRIIKKDKTTLMGSSVRIDKEYYVKYEEVPPRDETPLHLELIKDCSVTDQSRGNTPAMPSLRLEMRDRDYHEPQRDRDKNWFLESQRDVLFSKGCELVEPEVDLRLGEYEGEGGDHQSTLYWAKEFHNVVREQRIIRQAAIISDTNCIVDVFGIGINGRIFSDGSHTGRLLVVEVFSLWDCKKHTLNMTLLQLKTVFGPRPAFLKAGHKHDLVRELLRLMYFRYTVKIPNFSPGTPETPDFICTVDHLDPPNMPVGYPDTIEKMVRVPPVPPDDPEFTDPVVTQELCISPVRRDNGPEMRKRQAEARRIAEELAEAERMRIWLATPKRKRDRVAIQLVRGFNRFLALSAFHSHLRPEVVTLRGVVSFEAEPIGMIVPMGRVEKSVRITKSTEAAPTLEQCALATLRLLRLIPTESENGYTLAIGDATGLEIYLCFRRTVADLMHRRLARRRAAGLRSAVLGDPFQLDRELDRSEAMALWSMPAITAAAASVNTNQGLHAAQHSPPQVQLQHPSEPSNSSASPTNFTAPPNSSSNRSAAYSAGLAVSSDGSSAGERITAVASAEGVAVGEMLSDVVRRKELQAEAAFNDIMRMDPARGGAERSLCGWTSLGPFGSLRSTERAWGPVLQPLREIGRGKRLSCRVVRVGPARCVCTLRVLPQCQAKLRGPVPPWPRVATPEEVERGAEVVLETALTMPSGILDTVLAACIAAVVEEEIEAAKLAASSYDSHDDSDGEGRGDGDNGGEQGTVESYVEDFMHEDDPENGGEDRSVVSGSDDDDDDDGDRGLGQLEAINGIDIMNEAYAKIAPDVIVELEMYLPYEVYISGVCVPAGSLFRRYFTKDDLDRAAGARRDLLPVALRALYSRFPHAASPREVRDSEQAWDHLAQQLARTCHWSTRQWLPHRRWLHVKRLHDHDRMEMLSEQLSTAEKLIYAQNCLLHSDARLVHPDVAREPSEIGWMRGVRALDRRGVPPLAALFAADSVDEDDYLSFGKKRPPGGGGGSGGGGGGGGGGEGGGEKSEEEEAADMLLMLAEDDDEELQQKKREAEEEEARKQKLAQKMALEQLEAELSDPNSHDALDGELSDLQADNHRHLKVTLSWSNVVFSKSLRIQSTAQTRGEAVTLQVIMDRR